jgi:hypothetical protein
VWQINFDNNYFMSKNVHTPQLSSNETTILNLAVCMGNESWWNNTNDKCQKSGAEENILNYGYSVSRKFKVLHE